MITRNEKKLARELDKLNDKETLAVSAYISELLSKRISTKSENLFNDDLIASLSDKRENQRARQVIEWEKARRKINYKAA